MYGGKGMKFLQAKQKLEQWNQMHLLQFYDELAEDEKISLLKQIEDIDFSVIKGDEESLMVHKRGEITPLEAMQMNDIKERETYFFEIGKNALIDGKVAAVLLAGGMGTRLGSEDPKGMYNIGITRDVFIFQRLVENLLDVVRKVGCMIPLYIMTSEKNHQVTVDFFEEKNYFGYDRSFVRFFKQEMAAATDRTGKVLLEQKHIISTSPNGNGGFFKSMAKEGILDEIAGKVEWLNVFSVDNVLQRICDPCFVGAVIDAKVSVGSKVVKKTCKEERVGVMCLEDGKPSIVEYYELTQNMLDEINDKGELAYNYGVTLNYLFSVDKLKSIYQNSLEHHVVKKKVNYIDSMGEMVYPEDENAYKYEQLVLDMIYQLDSCLAYEVERTYEFAPIKNKDGVDSVDTARELLIQNGYSL